MRGLKWSEGWWNGREIWMNKNETRMADSWGWGENWRVRKAQGMVGQKKKNKGGGGLKWWRNGWRVGGRVLVQEVVLGDGSDSIEPHILPPAAFSSHAKQVCSAPQPSVTQRKTMAGLLRVSHSHNHPSHSPIQHPTGMGGGNKSVCWAAGGWAQEKKRAS